MSDSSLSYRIRDTFTVRIDKKTFAMIFVTVLSYLVWLIAFPLFGPIMGNYLAGLRTLAIERGRVIQIFLLAMLVSAFGAGYLIDRLLKRIIFIWGSTLLASVLTYAFLGVSDFLVLLPVSLAMGVVAGVCPAAWGAFFADNSQPEDRGRIMGVSVAFSMPIAYLFLIARSSGVLASSSTEFIVIGTLYLITLLTFFLKPREKDEEIRSARRRGGASLKQTIFYSGPVFLFYIVAGVLFSIVFPTIQDNVSSGVFYLSWGIPFVVGAVVGGVLLDSMGRRFPTIVGLAITGVSLAVLSLIGIKDGFVSIIPLSVGFAIVTVFSFVIWADLAPVKSRGLYYGLGFGLIAGGLLVGLMGVGTSFGSVAVDKIKSYMLYSSVALFLCIPPLIQAEDALPKEVIEKRQMEEHLRRARRSMEKRDR
jgi:MFS family permease